MSRCHPETNRVKGMAKRPILTNGTIVRASLADVQPGGRVRLGDQALSTAELRRNAHVLVLQEMRTRFTDAGSPSRTAALDAAISALSAQPSPGGQGGLNYERMFVDACAALAEVSRELGCDPEQGGAEPILAAIAELRAAQPSPGGQGALETARELLATEYDKAGERVFADRARKGQYDNDPDVHAIVAALAARQPVEAAPQGCDACDRTGIRQNDEGRNICCPDCDLGSACAGDTRQSVGESVEMSPEFTDTARAAIAWVLWHHQGGSSPVGQPLRFSLGMGQHDRMTDQQIAEAKRFAAWAGATTEGFHRHKTAQAVDLERFRGTVRSHHSMTEWMHRCGFVSAEKLEDSKKNHDHLLALIDSHSAGGRS